MITTEPADLKKLAEFIFLRMETCAGSCSSTHIIAIVHQVRGAIWMYTGKDPGYTWNNYEELFKAIDMPYEIEGDKIYAIVDGKRV
jgi:hypothetical protein